MIRRLAGVVLAASLLLGLVAGSASGEVPPGPRLAFMRATFASFELVGSDAAGHRQQVLAAGGSESGLLPFPYSPPTWSADGTQVAFAGLSGLRGRLRLNIYSANADGSAVKMIPGTREGLFPVLSPDGRMLAFARERPDLGKHEHQSHFHGVSIWLADLASGAVRQLTPWRDRLSDFPSSFSPDGSTLAISRQYKKQHKAVALRLDGSGQTVLADDAGEPVFSPDGTRLALITLGRRRVVRDGKGITTTYTPTELAVANADGSGLTRLTATPDSLEMQPSWDPSGQRLAYTQLEVRGGNEDLLGFGDSIMEINPDGTCRTRVLSYPKALVFGAVWQPGPGREAGPITC